MSNLVRIENNDGLEFHVDSETNLAYASVRATERMLGVKPGTLNMFLKTKEGAMFNATKMATVHTQKGLQAAKLFSAEQVFDLAFKYNLELAKRMGAAGANVFLLGMSGYKVQVVQPETNTLVPRTFAEALRLAAELEEEKERLQAKIEEDRPKVEFADAVDSVVNSISIEQFAKLTFSTFGLGRNNMFKRLRELDVVQPTNTLPYQIYVDAGYFEVGEVVRGDLVFPFAKVTGKGQAWLYKKLAA
jgi:phage antirepressor YoqD-like protein